MATAAQIEANRANAQLSTGPRSDQGKLAASQNAAKHNLTGGSALAPAEDASACKAHLAGYIQQYAPQSLPEEQLVNQLADAAWRLERVARMEREVLAQNPNPFLDPGDPMALQIMRLTRYRNSIQRTFNQASKQLQVLIEAAAARTRAHAESAKAIAYEQVRKEGGEPWSPEGKVEVSNRASALLNAVSESARTVLAGQNEANPR